MPNFNDSFIIETDALGEGIGAILTQQGKPITFELRTWYYKKIMVNIRQRDACNCGSHMLVATLFIGKEIFLPNQPMQHEIFFGTCGDTRATKIG